MSYAEELMRIVRAAGDEGVHSKELRVHLTRITGERRIARHVHRMLAHNRKIGNVRFEAGRFYAQRPVLCPCCGQRVKPGTSAMDRLNAYQRESEK